MTFDFSKVIPGMPKNEDEFDLLLREKLSEVGSKIANKSPYSPFYVLFRYIVAKPFLAMANLILTRYLPGRFLREVNHDEDIENLAWATNTERLPAQKTKGYITFFREITDGEIVIESNTTISSPPIDGITYKVITQNDETLLDGESSIKIIVEAEFEGTAYNLGDGYYSILEDSIDGIDSVSNEEDWIIDSGSDKESIEDLRYRCRDKWLTQSEWHTNAKYRYIIATFLNISPSNVFFDQTAPRGPGSADAYFILDTGFPSQDQVDSINKHINENGYHGLGDDMQVQLIPELPQDIEIEIYTTIELTEDEKTSLKSSIEDLIRASFRESSAYEEVPRVTPYKRFSWSKISRDIHNEFESEGAVDSISMISPSSDINPGLQLPTINTLVINVFYE